MLVQALQTSLKKPEDSQSQLELMNTAKAFITVSVNTFMVGAIAIMLSSTISRSPLWLCCSYCETITAIIGI